MGNFENLTKLVLSTIINHARFTWEPHHIFGQTFKLVLEHLLSLFCTWNKIMWLNMMPSYKIRARALKMMMTYLLHLTSMFHCWQALVAHVKHKIAQPNNLFWAIPLYPLEDILKVSRLGNELSLSKMNSHWCILFHLALFDPNNNYLPYS
jgi:hypothetical protein